MPSGNGKYGVRTWGGSAGWMSRRAAYQAGKKVASSKWARARRKITFRRGYDRTRGYYGRFRNAGAELKFHDLDVNDAVVAVAGTVQTALCAIPQNDTENGRDGRKCTITSIGWRWELLLNNTGTLLDTSDVVRIMLVLDKQANGALPAVTDVLATDDYQSFNNLANSSRFRTLYDKTISISAVAGSGRGTTDTMAFGEKRIQGTFFKKCNVLMEYDNTAITGVITSIRSNNIFAIVLSLSGNCAFASKMRLRFRG